jgi:hypothetical protein
MWSDNETELDLLGVSHLAAAVKQIVTSKHLLPTTIGLFGDWGSGKTSLSCQLQKDLEQDKKILCVTFNGWQQEDFEDAKLALMGTLLDALVENRDAWNKAKEIVGRLAGRINRMKLGELLIKVGAPIASAVAAAHGADPNMLALAASQGVAGVKPNELKDIIKSEAEKDEPLRKSAREFRKDFEELLDKTGVETLVVFIDDLDRCLPDTVVDTLEAVRLFLYTPQTAFVICADPRVVRAAVRHRYPQSDESPDLPNEYLEKLIQFPIQLTPLAPPDVSRYMMLLFAELHLGADFAAAVKSLPSSREELESMAPRQLAEKLRSPLPSELNEAVAIVEQVGDELASHLNGNPRQVKRFLNMLMLRMGMAADRGAKLNRRILAKLMLLEYLRPDQFRQLATWQAGQSGPTAELKRLEYGAVTPAKPATAVAGRKAAGASAAIDDSLESPVDETAINSWRADGWLKRWAASEPALAAVDLRPYFYVARETLGTIIVPGLRLSSLAERILGELLSSSKAQRTKALRAAKELADHDARSVFLALTERCRKTEKLDVDGSPLEMLIELTKARPELVTNLLQVIASLPHSSLGSGVPPQVAALRTDFAERAPEVDGILVGWGTSTNPMLAAAAKKMAGR